MGREAHGPRKAYWMWGDDDPDMAEQERRIRAFAGQSRARLTPSKQAMYREGPEALLDGWLPAEPLINADTRVIAIGSCFAGLFAEWLAAQGFNRAFDPTSDVSLVRNPLETPAVVAQQFRWAFGDFDPDLAFWFTPDKQRFYPTEERRETLRTTLSQAEVIIITLGLAETWFDVESGEPIWRLPPSDQRDERYAFKVSGVAESVEALETIDRIRREHLPNTKIVYTVSPVRFNATFRSMSPIVANVASKAIVRAALDEFLRAHSEEINNVYHYFPSYEIVRELLTDPYSDNRHIHLRYSNVVIDLFARHYTTLVQTASSQTMALPADAIDELRKAIASLEEAHEQLETICAERLTVIRGLETACDERLVLIQRLQAEIDRLQPAPSST